MPGVSIDTNINELRLFTRSFRSEKPYDLHLDFTDESRMWERVEIDAVVLTYRPDDTMESVRADLDGLKLPRSFAFRPYETVNSSSKGIVRKTAHVLDGELEGVVDRDEDLTLRVEGRFIRMDAEPTPFAGELDFESTREKRIADRMTLLSDV